MGSRKERKMLYMYDEEWLRPPVFAWAFFFCCFLLAAKLHTQGGCSCMWNGRRRWNALSKPKTFFQPLILYFYLCCYALVNMRQLSLDSRLGFKECKIPSPLRFMSGSRCLPLNFSCKIFSHPAEGRLKSTFESNELYLWSEVTSREWKNSIKRMNYEYERLIWKKGLNWSVRLKIIMQLLFLKNLQTFQ